MAAVGGGDRIQSVHKAGMSLNHGLGSGCQIKEVSDEKVNLTF